MKQAIHLQFLLHDNSLVSQAGHVMVIGVKDFFLNQQIHQLSICHHQAECLPSLQTHTNLGNLSSTDFLE